MRKMYSLLTLFFAILTVTGCEKQEDNDGMVEIFTESLSGNGKVLVDGADATWMAGDEILLNGSPVMVVRHSNGRAYISSEGLNTTTNRAVYPSSLNVYNWSTDNLSVEFPKIYHYRTDASGKQILELPMAAYSTGDNPLHFKHLTGALYVTVTNTGSSPRLLQAVTVSSDKYMLNGSRSIDLTNIDALGPIQNESASRRTVTLHFDAECILPANGGSKKVMIPILPVGGDNHFTISVKTYQEGESQSFVTTKSQTSNSDHSLGRNILGYAPIDIVAGAETREAILSYDGGTYKLYSGTDFYLMTKMISGGSLNNASFDLKQDIDMSGITIEPIVNDVYGGTINGANHCVSNLTIRGIKEGNEGNEVVFCALFKYTKGNMTIKDIRFDNLNLINEDVGTAKLYVGAFEAKNEESGDVTRTLSNCIVNIGQFEDGNATGEVYFGGLFGQLSPKLEITDCHVTLSDVTIDGSFIRFGGMVGSSVASALTISRSSWRAGSLTLNASNACVGGLVGAKSSGQFNASDCVLGANVNATLQGSNKYFGNLVGRIIQSIAQAQAQSSNITTSISYTLNGNTITPGDFGINR